MRFLAGYVDGVNNPKRLDAEHASCEFRAGKLCSLELKMNSASQNFAHHLGILRERMLHPSDYEKAVYYFLEEFAGDKKFVQASDCEQMPHIVAVLTRLVSNAIGRQ